jgi:CTP synthase (UTP-ammonia lyase)
VGHQGVVQLTANTHAERLLGRGQTFERYFCRYGVNPAHVQTLADHGLVFSGHDTEGDVRIAELPTHPFFLAALFQPELADGPRPHAFIRAFAEAATAHTLTSASRVRSGP